MTKSTITRDELNEVIATYGKHHIAHRMANALLAAMDSEPVIVVGDDGGDALSYRRLIQSFAPGTKLYRHAQPASVVPDAEAVYVRLSDHEKWSTSLENVKHVLNACRAAMLADAPQSPGSDPATVPGKWIPVSERLPDEDDHVLVSDGVGMEVSWIRGREWKKLRHIYSEDITHWMPLPAAPQEG